MTSTLVYLPANELAVGHFVHLELGWLEHPFPFNTFKILSQEQLDVIRGLRLSKVRVDLKKSSVAENPPPPALVEETPSKTETSPAQTAAIEMKRQRIAQNQVLRTRINATEKQFVQAAKTCRELNRSIFSNPKGSIEQANCLIGGLADSLLNDSEAIVHLLGDKIAGEEIYHHSLNVAMLALLLGREMKLERHHLDVIGLAALLHDIGKVEIPDRVLLKNERDGVGPGFFITTLVMDILLGFVAAMIVAWFSRQREFRADAGAAQLMGRKQPMINALARLGGLDPGEMPKTLQAMGISARPSSLMALFSSHPPMEQRIARLQQAG